VTDGPPLREHVEQDEKECWKREGGDIGVQHSLVLDLAALDIDGESGYDDRGCESELLEHRKSCSVSQYVSISVSL
jgi:hypothetical protein